ncbi:MAG: hypothetical protein V5A45_00400 [Haloarculaceae archaeon]
MTARVPFALVGVLLLVGSATFAGSLGGPTVSEPGVDRAMDRTESATQSAVREAVTSAATEAARNPVTVPASSSFGVAVSDESPFRDALRVRIYVAVRDRLDRISRQRDGITVSASLPPTPSGRALADATQRVSISRAGNQGTSLRATVRNVSLTAHRDDQVVGERTVSPTVTVPVPTLAVHDRVSTFERQLNAGPGESGLGSRLTAKLYALTWTRGFAQFGGAPIENVVANRHLGLLTNGIALSMQREQFGQSDPRGRSVLGWATAHTAITDMLSGSDNRVARLLSDAQSYAGRDTLSEDALSYSGATNSSVAPTDEITIAVNDTADLAFARLLKDVNGTIDRTYDARVQLRQQVVSETEHVVQKPREPGKDWELLGIEREETRLVQSRDGAAPAIDRPWHRFEYHPRQVVVRTTVERRWETPSGEETTVEVREQRGDVDVSLVGRHDGGTVPDRPVETIHKSGGPLDGPNLKEVEATARERLVGNRDIDALAVEALLLDGQTSTVTVEGTRPDGIYEFVYSDLRWVRELVRDLSVTTTRGELATFQVNPGAELAKKLESRQEDLLALPDSYGSIADRARFNARAAYLRTVLVELRKRAANHEKSQSNINDELEDRDRSGIDQIQDNYDDRGETAATSSLGLDMRVETTPSYLTLGELDGQSVPTLSPDVTTTPLVARNVNFFTVPYGDLAQGLAAGVLGPNRVRLQTAVQTLKSAQNADEGTRRNMSTNIHTLESKTVDALGHLNSQAATVVLGGTPADIGDSKAVVSSALGRWETTVGLGQAWLNGSAIEAVHAEIERRYDLSEPQSDQIDIELRLAAQFTLASKRGQPPQPIVNKTSAQLKELARERLKSRLEDKTSDKLSDTVKRGLEKTTGRTLSQMPAGLPLAPPVTPWVTTVNYWEVEVRGEYSRFAVSVPRGTPDTPGARFTYVRDSGTVSLDLDEDGTEERLGRTTRISFRTQTSVAIAVPPKPRGVGDVDGTMDEKSPGWPHPG